MEHSSGSILIGRRAFSAHLPLIPPPLWPSIIALRLLSGESRSLVISIIDYTILYYVQDLSGGPLCPFIL